MNSKTNRSDGSKASVVRFCDAAALRSRCLSLEEASLDEGRLTGERTEQETQRVRRLFSNHHGVPFLQNYFMAFICTLRKSPFLKSFTLPLSWSIFHSSHFSFFRKAPHAIVHGFRERFFITKLVFYQPFSLLPIFYSGNGKSYTRRHFLLFPAKDCFAGFFIRNLHPVTFAGAVGFAAGFGVSVHCRTDLVHVFPVFLYPAVAFRFRWYPEQLVELPVFDCSFQIFAISSTRFCCAAVQSRLMAWMASFKRLTLSGVYR